MNPRYNKHSSNTIIRSVAVIGLLCVFATPNCFWYIQHTIHIKVQTKLPGMVETGRKRC